MNSDRCIDLRDHPQSQNTDHFPHPRKFPCVPLCSTLSWFSASGKHSAVPCWVVLGTVFQRCSKEVIYLLDSESNSKILKG